MRFTTKAEAYELLKIELLENLTAYIEAIQQTTYEDSQDREKGKPLVNTYSAAVASNMAFRSFINKDKLQSLLKEAVVNIE